MAGFSPYGTAKRGEMWRVAWRDESGKQKTKRGFESEEAARSWWFSDQSPGDPDEYMTVAEGYARWTRSHAREWSAATVASTSRVWRLHVEPVWASRMMHEITTQEIQEWLDEATDRLSSATLSRLLTVLRGALQVGVRRHVIRDSPADGVSLPRPRETSDVGHVSVPHALAIADAAETGARVPGVGAARAAMVRLLAATGISWSEMAALRVSDVDPDGSQVRVTRAVPKIDGTLIYGPPRGGEARTVSVPEWAQESLADAVVAARARRKPASELLFVTNRGTPHRSPGRGEWWGAALTSAREVDPTIPESLSPDDLRQVVAEAANPA